MTTKSKPSSEIVCHGKTSIISCPDGDVIGILDGWYGFSPKINTQCAQSGENPNKCGTDAVKSLSLLCGSNRACQITALDDRFPATNCAANTGFLKFSFRCTPYSSTRVPQITKVPFTRPQEPNTFLTQTVSSGSVAPTWCFPPTPGMFIKDAFYGNSEQGCQINVTHLVRFDCEVKQICFIAASTGAYGDPKCPSHVSKILTVRYWCGPAVGTPAPPKQPMAQVPTGNAPPVGINAQGCGQQTILTSRVITGTNSKPGQWPWQAEIFVADNYHLCGGSLISSDWILTAAHCFAETSKPGDFFVVLGEFNRTKFEGTEYKYTVQRIIRHSLYKADGQVDHDRDIALLKISPTVAMTNYIRTVCLPSENELDTDYYQDCFLTGWGRPNYPGFSAYILQQGMLQAVNNTACETKLSNAIGDPGDRITENMLCANDRLKIGISGCKGDSGGPFVCRKKGDNLWYLRGLVSWGSERCYIKDMYQVLTRVSKFRQWITTNLV